MFRHALAFALLSAAAYGQTGHLLLRQPALSRTSIVFSFAGDLWSVPREGGEARRLTTGTGREFAPYFSPDGSQIAFTGEYDGNIDVFTIPAEGGMPKRLTFHPSDDYAAGWTPDGKRVLFVSKRNTGTDAVHFYTVPAEGGFAEMVPLPLAVEGSYAPDGTHLAYVPLFQWQSAWKRYRGGQTRKIWLANLADSSVAAIPRENSNDFNPMWVGDKVYFLSDRNGPVTLFVYDTKSKQVKQCIENKGLDFKSASAGPGAIVYEQFGGLHLYDLASGKTKEVPVKLAGDFPELRTHYVNAGKRLKSAALSPGGARAVFEARGEIVTVPAEKGDWRNLSNSPGANEHDPAWSPDGQTIAYLSDEGGEYMLHLKPQDGMGEATKIKLGDKPAFYTSPTWSHDGKKIAYLDNHLHVWYLELGGKKPILVDTDTYAGGDLTPSWSPDSKWLTYSKQARNHLSAVYIYSLADAKATQVTDGLGDALSPEFDKDGKYFYFRASTNSGPGMEADIGAFSRPVNYSLYLAVLSRSEPSPFAPESDEEKKKEDAAAAKKDEPKKDDAKPADDKKGDGKKDEAKKDEAKKDDTPEVKIDFENIGQRIVAIPVPPRRYANLRAGKAGTLFYTSANAPDTPNDPGPVLHRFDLSKRKEDTVTRGVGSYAVSGNGEKVLYQQGEKWTVANAADNGDPKELKVGDIELRVEPRAEWRQMYHEAWRIIRDFFYDPHYHGLDLQAAEERYANYLDGIASRADLNYLFTEMLGELSVGHEFIGGGDQPEVKHIPTGLLGADFNIENGHYRIARIYNGENFNPDLKAPLTQPGVNVKEGDYIFEVNGREVSPNEDIYSYFETTAGKATVIKVGSNSAGSFTHLITVVPIADEDNLRHLAWVEENRRIVDKLSGGKVAYVHMPDTARGGFTSFTRYFFAQLDKQAVIIDDRFNHGGQLATDVVEVLNRKPMSFVSTRDGADVMQPLGAIYGPKVMIVNEFAGSGGDAMPWYFRRAGTGKLVGMRTWGGLVGMMGFPDLMDGGVVTAPNAAVWNPNGTMDVENKGVAPDIEVDMDPAAVRQGHDPQLEKAVQVVMEELAKSPPPEFKKSALPNYHKQQ